MRYGLEENETQNFAGILNAVETGGTIRRAEKILRDIYCGHVGAEFAYIDVEHERDWLSASYEASFATCISAEDKREIATLLIRSQAWDNFLATKFPSVKRYGGEGAESMMAFFRQLFLSATEAEVAQIVLGMPHRGKLNLLTTMLKTRPAKIFRKFKGQPEFPENVKAMCDIASHFRKIHCINTSTDFECYNRFHL